MDLLIFNNRLVHEGLCDDALRTALVEQLVQVGGHRLHTRGRTTRKGLPTLPPAVLQEAAALWQLSKGLHTSCVPEMGDAAVRLQRYLIQEACGATPCGQCTESHSARRCKRGMNKVMVVHKVGAALAEEGPALVDRSFEVYKPSHEWAHAYATLPASVHSLCLVIAHIHRQ